MTVMFPIGANVGESMLPSTAGPPTTFQTMAVIVLGTLVAISLTGVFLGRVTRREGLGWAVLWSCAAVAILRPEWTGRIARVLGIGRGADLVLYGAVVVMMVGFMMVYVRMRRFQRELTLVVRHLAIREAEETKEGPRNGANRANEHE